MKVIAVQPGVRGGNGGCQRDGQGGGQSLRPDQQFVWRGRVAGQVVGQQHDQLGEEGDQVRREALHCALTRGGGGGEREPVVRKEVNIEDVRFLVPGVSVSNEVDPRLPRSFLNLYKERSGLLEDSVAQSEAGSV